MKPKHIIALHIVLFLAFFSLFVANNWNKQILYLNDGRIIETRETWESLGDIFYETDDGILHSIKTADVAKSANATFASIEGWVTILGREVALKRGVFAILWDKRVWVGYVLAVCGWFAIAVARRLKTRKQPETETDAGFEKLLRLPVDPEAPDIEKIVIYFLNLFLLQNNAEQIDKYKYKRIAGQGKSNTAIYELGVRQNGKWLHRRMSLGRIGESAGSRSKCFHAIYDTPIVIKIPPQPVNDFNDYVKNIQADKRIAGLLAPRDCLTPSVTIVLARLPSFLETVGRCDIKNEQKCIQTLNLFTEYHKFLKIGDQYAFFMDLARYFFLGNILDELHDVDHELTKEISNYQDLIWTAEDFGARYGDHAVDICFKLQHVFKAFDTALNDSDILPYEKKAWFVRSLLPEDEMHDTPQMPVAIAAILQSLKKEYADHYGKYNALVKNYVRHVAFRQKRTQIQSICTNLIEMLAWLGSKYVAMRDLKPDNLTIIGDPSNYPHFLNSADDFRIGFIDVETAAYANPHDRQIDQPILALTASYATPSHMLPNDLLGKIHDDTCYILHLQDWYATIALIHETITGAKLFVSTAGMLTRIRKKYMQHLESADETLAFFKAASPKFWHTAATEFNRKIKQRKNLLKSVQVELSDGSKQLFTDAAQKARQYNPGHANRLMGIGSNTSAYEILELMFRHVYETMHVKGQAARAQKIR